MQADKDGVGRNAKRWFFDPQLALALGAVEGRAAGLDDAAHPLGAIARGARVAFATIDGPAVLEIAELAIGLDIIAQRGAAGLDRLGQDRADGSDEAVGTASPDRGGETPRRDRRARNSASQT